jgi:ElaB/YqjD/DUF883 family membrane-anchored ribosome-binding protein
MERSAWNGVSQDPSIDTEVQMTAGDPRDDASGVVKDEAYARLEKEMTAMKTTIGNLSQQVADATSSVGDVARTQARRGLRRARANIDSIVSDASDRARAVASAAETQAASIGDTLAEVIEERPLSTVAIALGLGFLIGVTWRR